MVDNEEIMKGENWGIIWEGNCRVNCRVSVWRKLLIWVIKMGVKLVMSYCVNERPLQPLYNHNRLGEQLP